MNYTFTDIDAFTLTGLPLRIDNSAEGMEKLQQHWAEFYKRGLPKVLGLKDDSIICEAYFDFASDASGPFTLLLGRNDAAPPPPAEGGLLTRSFPAGRYAKFHVAGPQEIRGAWLHIWERQDLARSFSCDFELIGPDGVDIYVAVKR